MALSAAARNGIMAGGLAAFVGSVYVYTMRAVGKNDVDTARALPHAQPHACAVAYLSFVGSCDQLPRCRRRAGYLLPTSTFTTPALLRHECSRVARRCRPGRVCAQAISQREAQRK